MQCERARELASRELDGHLDANERSALASHQASCAACAEASADQARLRDQVAALGREAAPSSLRKRVMQELAETRPEVARPRLPRWHEARIAPAGLAAAVIIACLVSSALTAWVWNRGDALALLEHDVVTAHVRSLLDTPIQVASSETHTVKPWFAGRVDVSPIVRDLSAEGFVLAGGRLDYVNGRRVAVVVYKQRQHVVNVFTWAASAPQPARSASRNGYNLLMWSARGITYCAISDLNAAEMEHLRSLL